MSRWLGLLKKIVYEEGRYYSRFNKAVFGKADAVSGLQGTLGVKENAASIQRATGELYLQRNSKKLKMEGHFAKSLRMRGCLSIKQQNFQRTQCNGRKNKQKGRSAQRTHKIGLEIGT